MHTSCLACNADRTNALTRVKSLDSGWGTLTGSPNTANLATANKPPANNLDLTAAKRRLRQARRAVQRQARQKATTSIRERWIVRRRPSIILLLIAIGMLTSQKHLVRDGGCTIHLTRRCLEKPLVVRQCRRERERRCRESNGRKIMVRISALLGGLDCPIAQKHLRM